MRSNAGAGGRQSKDRGRGSTGRAVDLKEPALGTFCPRRRRGGPQGSGAQGQVTRGSPEALKFGVRSSGSWRQAVSPGEGPCGGIRTTSCPAPSPKIRGNGMRWLRRRVGLGLQRMLREAPGRTVKDLHTKCPRRCPRAPSPSLQAAPTRSSEQISLHLPFISKIGRAN